LRFFSLTDADRMKNCPACQTANAETNRFCQQCGRPLDAAPDAEATVRWTGQRLSAEETLRPSVAVEALFAGKVKLVVGRAPDCDVCLPHPMVSRYHALVERLDGGLRIRDLASVNGVSVNGRRIAEPARVGEGDRVGVGPYLFTLAGGVVHSLDSSRSLRLEAHHLEKVIRLPGGQVRKLLDNVSLVVNPGEFVSLLGPSGSGKSTLMDCLNGRRRATGGKVLANGEDFYRHFDSFRQSLGYVPQRDIVHAQLTVFRALYYTARLRLPTDTDPGELRARIEEVIRLMELGPHRDTLVANLSGGQIKRVSLGAELIAAPCLLYIDEATSGLDAGTEARMMRLFRRLADEGRSIVCITHNVDNVDRCHLALVLARGKLIYYGPPAEATAYFRVQRVSEIYDRLAEKDVADWEKEFVASSLYQEFVGGRLAAPTQPRGDDQAGVSESGARRLFSGLLAEGRKLVSRSEGAPLADRFRALTARYLRFRSWVQPVLDLWHQFLVLTARYVELIVGDQRSLRLLFLQAPIVALFLLVGFFGKDFQSKVPSMRPLTEGERKALAVLKGLDEFSLPGKEPDADQRGALHKLRFEVELAGKEMTLDGVQVVQLLRQLNRQPANAAQRQEFADAIFAVEAGGERVHFSGADALQLLTQLHESHLPARLLAINGPVIPDGEIVNPRFTYMLLFILVMIVLWFGCNNAAKEIVKEEAIYGRERAVNLAILPYLASKFLVLTVITAFHALVLMALLYGGLDLGHRFFPGFCTLPDAGHYLALVPQFGVLVLLAMAGVALGLLLSACVSSPDRANALLPYVLIPQMILGGGILSADSGVLHYLAVSLSPVYWAYRAVHCGAHELPRSFPFHVPYADDVTLPCQALLIQTAVLLLLTAWFLRRKSV
jgi:ABC-type multidrug transport system ATPase subunit